MQHPKGSPKSGQRLSRRPAVSPWVVSRNSIEHNNNYVKNMDSKFALNPYGVLVRGDSPFPRISSGAIHIQSLRDSSPPNLFHGQKKFRALRAFRGQKKSAQSVDKKIRAIRGQKNPRHSWTKKEAFPVGKASLEGIALPISDLGRLSGGGCSRQSGLRGCRFRWRLSSARARRRPASGGFRAACQSGRTGGRRCLLGLRSGC